ncbi:MAG: glycine oxidase ThiO [Terriglobales bacterium]
MKTWDVVIIGAGVIGVSLAVELRRSGLTVLVLEKHQPGREASWAAGGMLADREAGSNLLFRSLAKESAAMYPQFVHRLQDESRMTIQLREQGTIRFLDDDQLPEPIGDPLTDQDIRRLEPQVTYSAPAVFLAERCVDPRELMDGLLATAKHLGVDVSSGSEVIEIEVQLNRAVAAVTSKSRYPGNAIVNCAGAWAGAISPVKIPTIPVKGQMLAVAPSPVKHVVRGNSVYLIPREKGRLVIGATVEDVGFDKRVFPETIQHLHQAAAVVAPNVGQARILEDWAGLRPATPDKLPMMGATSITGYFVATGHYRDGILLAPITAKLMAQMIRGEKTGIDLTEFSPMRFS